MDKHHIVRTVVTTITEENFRSIYNAERRANEIKDTAGDFKKVDWQAGITTVKKTVVDVVNMKDVK